MNGDSDLVLVYDGGTAPVLRSLPPLAPKPGEVRYRVHAFALNRAELLYLDRSHYVPSRSDTRIGYEACGIVDAVGEGVTEFRPGDKVSSIPFASDAYGVNGQWAITPAEWLSPWPDNYSAEEACSFWMQYLTAYYPLVMLAPVGSGDAVLISAASSSAALGAMQLARLLGARTIGLTRDADKVPRLLALGYDAAVATSTSDLVAALEAARAGLPIRCVYDAVLGDLPARYGEALTVGATIFAYGSLSGDPEIRLPLLASVRRALSVLAYSTPNYSHDPIKRETARRFILQAIAAKGLRPVIDSVTPFDRVADAYARLTSGHQVGKIVVRVAL